jgi:hypothetical protein
MYRSEVGQNVCRMQTGKRLRSWICEADHALATEFTNLRALRLATACGRRLHSDSGNSRHLAASVEHFVGAPCTKHAAPCSQLRVHAFGHLPVLRQRSQGAMGKRCVRRISHKAADTVSVVLWQ